jgi:hypothetical protein
MADLMIDIEGLGTGPDTTILTIAAQSFDPLGQGYHDRYYYARIDLESQPDRSIQQGTIDWWATQPAAARNEAFNEHDRIPLDQALDQLAKFIWQSRLIWANGPTYDMNIIEHAYKSYGRPLPWQFYVVLECGPNRLGQRSSKIQIVLHVIDTLYIALCQYKDDLIGITDKGADCVNSVCSHFLLLISF